MAASRAWHCLSSFSRSLGERASSSPLPFLPSLSSASPTVAAAGFSFREYSSGGAQDLPDDFAKYQQHKTPKFSGLPTLLKAPLADTLDGLDIALVGVPFDGGASHPGTRFGPREIRNKSSMLRKIHGATGVAPFSLCQVADVGDVVIKRPWHGVESAQHEIYDYFRQLCKRGIIPITAGGDHSISYPILRAVAEAAGGPVGLVHLDAHHDTVDLDESEQSTGSKYWNGTPFSCALADGLIDPKRTIQIGIRGPMSPGKMLSEEAGMRVVDMEEFYELGPKKVAQEAREIVGDGPTYITFDVDALDPAYAIGTGSPEDGGLTTLEAQIILRGLRGLQFVGADFVCTSPLWDPTGNTPRVAANMMFEQLCLVAESIHRRRKQ